LAVLLLFPFDGDGEILGVEHSVLIQGTTFHGLAGEGALRSPPVSD
jgi:hypothetical protein